VAKKVGTTPATGLLDPSRRVIVTLAVATPLATIGPEEVIVEFAATAPSGVKITFPSALTNGVAIERVLVSGVRDFKVQEDTPLMVD
jgi:hypothetical protein